MFCLTSGSFLSIVLRVRCINVFTHKSLRNKVDLSIVAMVELLELSDSRKLDV